MKRDAISGSNGIERILAGCRRPRKGPVGRSALCRSVGIMRPRPLPREQSRAYAGPPGSGFAKQPCVDGRLRA